MSRATQSTRRCHTCSKSYEPKNAHLWWSFHSGSALACQECMQNIFITGTTSNRVGSISCCPQHPWTAASWTLHIAKLFDRKTAKKILNRMKELDSVAGNKIVCSNKQCGATILQIEKTTENLMVEHLAVPCTVSVVKVQTAVNEKADYDYYTKESWTSIKPALALAGTNERSLHS